jgi:hypothetical protein
MVVVCGQRTLSEADSLVKQGLILRRCIMGMSRLTLSKLCLVYCYQCVEGIQEYTVSQPKRLDLNNHRHENPKSWLSYLLTFKVIFGRVVTGHAVV